MVHAPELDDLNDTDDLTPLRLAVPAQFRADPGVDAHTADDLFAGHRADATDVIPLLGRHGQHRKPDTSSAVRSRLMIAAMAAGAAAAAAHSMDTQKTPAARSDTILAANQSALTDGVISTAGDGMQLVTVTPAVDTAVANEEMNNGVAFAQERAQREARLERPLFVFPAKGVWTSGFGYRWGVLHGGIDIANAIGTPIFAAADGVVIDCGPTAGFGMWVKLRHDDGTVTLYGHVNTTTVDIGQRVMAGDQIATMGNRGNSTGPHLHFEVLLNGTDRVDPVPWLAQRGLSPGNYVG